jgi:hypothetical protein
VARLSPTSGWRDRRRVGSRRSSVSTSCSPESQPATRRGCAQVGRERPRILTGRYFCLGADADATADEYIRHYYGDQFFDAARADTLTTDDHLASEVLRVRDAGCDEVVLYPCSADLDQVDRLASALERVRP